MQAHANKSDAHLQEIDEYYWEGLQKRRKQKIEKEAELKTQTLLVLDMQKHCTLLEQKVNLLLLRTHTDIRVSHCTHLKFRVRTHATPLSDKTDTHQSPENPPYRRLSLCKLKSPSCSSDKRCSRIAALIHV